MPKTMSLSVEINLVSLTGNAWLAAANLGGITIRGDRRPDAVEAAQSLFARLAGNGMSAEDAGTAIELALAGTTLDRIGSSVLELGHTVAEDEELDGEE
jgi:hypothetical protein